MKRLFVLSTSQASIKKCKKVLGINWARTLGEGRFMRLLFLILLLTLLIGCGGDDYGKISAPEGLTATAGVQKITLDWNIVSNADNYEIYWTNSVGIYTTYDKNQLTKISPAMPPYEHTDLTPGIKYQYYVQARRKAYGSDFSQDAVAIPLAP